MRFLAAIEDRTRFGNAHAVQPYIAHTRRELKLGEETDTGIMKAGPSELRRTVVHRR